MLLRRAFLWWQFAAVVVLPAGLFLARGVVDARLGWDVLLSALAAPVLAFALLVVAVLTLIRPSVLRSRAVSWFDVAVLTGWHAAVIWLCVAPTGWLVGVIAVLALVAFWGAIWQLVTDTTRRVRGAMRGFTAEFHAGRRSGGGPIDLGELRPLDERTDASPRRSVAE